MSCSILSCKISICSAFDCCDEDSYLDVIRVIADELGFDFIKAAFRSAILKRNTIDTNSIQNIKQRIEQIIPMVGNSSASTTNDNDGNTMFPLLRLPIDIIKNTSLFLNETDIFSFEKCCRLFYKMINNLSYLKQTKNFKTFFIGKKRWNQMRESNYSFYKYSQCDVLDVMVHGLGARGYNRSKRVTRFIHKTQSKWEQARHISKYNDNWLENVFKSIKSLRLNHDSTVSLLNKLPLNLLFDPQSKLESLAISHYWNFGDFQKGINEFERQYSELRQKYQQENKRIKKLKKLEHCDVWGLKVTGPRGGIETEHLVVQTHADCDIVEMTDIFCNSKMKILTFKDGCNVDVSKLDGIDCNCNIETLRLINFYRYSHTSICINDSLIEKLNLHKSIINLTVEISMWWCNKAWLDTIETILLKQHFHNLKNVNILIAVKKENIYKLFDMLKKNVNILKHQFNKLNFGLKIVYQARKYFKHTFEWSARIDAKFLDAKQEELLRHQANQEINGQHKTDKENFDKFLSQWL